MRDIPSIFGSLVFDDACMKARLPRATYNKLKHTIEENEALDSSLASEIANAMKDWAIEHGVTHFTHWFQPMTGITAEKHDSFITPSEDGGIIMEFSGKELIKGEPDASSFPSGGLRATFEARGYTAWDPTSYAFIKGDTLCIPTAFCSYTGEALDKKTPLMRSLEVLEKQTLRIVKLFGNKDVQSIVTTVGPEQEYFLIDKNMYEKRRDLMYTGRTLFGAKPPKGQEMDDHYFGTLKPRVSAFMRDLDEELWKLGILAKTEHNEAAPAQHELAPIYTTTNIATDHNQLTMELMKTVAKRHDLVCLLHEKPFKGVNGSGKHNNWSLSTDTGKNLLDPGKTPWENVQFLLILTAVLQAVDEYQELLRMAVATAGNDHRLGANEAPPAIISVFLGDELTDILESVANDTQYEKRDRLMMDAGVNVLPQFAKDTTDRNRTSPFAFTGNKFEFRMLGSSMSIAGPNFILNTMVAEIFSRYADALENSTDITKDAKALIKEKYNEHKRIVFNGNNYTDEWEEEAKRRGLSNYKTTPDVLPKYLDDINVELFTKHNVLSKVELCSRCEIKTENYCKTINIEALTMVEMAKREIFPAVVSYQKAVADEINAKRTAMSTISCTAECDHLEKISSLCDKMYKEIDALVLAHENTNKIEDLFLRAKSYNDSVVASMNELRATVDELETLVDKKYWPMPTYGDLLFSV